MTAFSSSIAKNLVLNTDSYKASHWGQYRPGATATFSYAESRGGTYDRTVFFGLQTILKEYLSRTVSREDVEEAKALFEPHGVPFNFDGWLHVVEAHGGKLPVRIRAVPEGMVVPTHNVLFTVESTDPRAFWLPSYLETLLLRVWYPTTVATISWHIKRTIRRHLAETSDAPDSQLPFKLHDFGARGVSSLESAALGGLSHLVNFMGSDTVAAVLAARAYYREPMAAFSIPAAEHSTITSWGREGEVEAYRNMLRLFARPGKLVAVVSDSYDLFGALRTWGTTLKDEVIASGATLVIRPDSGVPEDIVAQCAVALDGYFGSDVNGKGFKVLRHVRIIQGDGINEESIGRILLRLRERGFSADNVAFGMGGALLQHMNRDTQRFAMKCSAVLAEGRWFDVNKDPLTDPGKASKKGRLSLYRSRATGALETRRIETTSAAEYDDVLVPVWENGELLADWTLAEVRARAEEAGLPNAHR